MKRKQILCFVLAGCLLSSILTGCKANNSMGENVNVIETETASEVIETESVGESEVTENPSTEVSSEEEKNPSTEIKESETSSDETKPEKRPSNTDKDKPAKPEKEYKPSKLEKNIFFDSLVYTGYNIEKHRADGMMWKYLLASKKRDKGWLSNIGYAGGSSGYEVTADGKPDIRFFEKNGLVCASYATYVYYNYLPNVAGIDVSALAKPKRSYNADDWYKAAQKWIEDGYSKEVGFKASLTSSGFIKFSLEEEIPIGSILAFCDAKNKSDECSHIVIYAGYKNNYHWVYHVGNDNGPEFCAVERMHFGPDPQWPIAVITTPDFIVEAMK